MVARGHAMVARGHAVDDHGIRGNTMAMPWSFTVIPWQCHGHPSQRPVVIRGIAIDVRG